MMLHVYEDNNEKAASDAKLYTHCGRCGRPLTNTESRRVGMGPVCYRKHQALIKAIEEAREELQAEAEMEGGRIDETA